MIFVLLTSFVNGKVVDNESLIFVVVRSDITLICLHSSVSP